MWLIIYFLYNCGLRAVIVTLEKLRLTLLVPDHHGGGLEGDFPAKPVIPFDAGRAIYSLWVGVVQTIQTCVATTEN